MSCGVWLCSTDLCADLYDKFILRKVMYADLYDRFVLREKSKFRQRTPLKSALCCEPLKKLVTAERLINGVHLPQDTTCIILSKLIEERWQMTNLPLLPYLLLPLAIFLTIPKISFLRMQTTLLQPAALIPPNVRALIGSHPALPTRHTAQTCRAKPCYGPGL
jgi:hypothetical protein